jgi:TetR/AcrR family transcriptional repressor of nem operon
MDRHDTRQALLDHAEHLVRIKGYAAFSYADLAAVVGIRKASVHHHFPTKEQLGVELVARYSEEFFRRLDGIDTLEASPLARLQYYAALYREGVTRGEACLCGMLAAETAAVPPAVAGSVARFLRANREWLTGVVEAGQRRGDFLAPLVPAQAAAALLATLQGAAFVARNVEDIDTFDDAVAAVLRMVLSGRSRAEKP